MNTDVPHSVLVLGGYGFFGRRIGAKLAAHPRIRLLIAGRSLNKAREAASELSLPLENAFEIDADDPRLQESLSGARVDTVIHAAGPFQNQDYAVARAAIRARCNYIDLADGRAFVTGIGTLDLEARRQQVSAVSGASSVPGLSSAVVDRYLPQSGWTPSAWVLVRVEGHRELRR